MNCFFSFLDHLFSIFFANKSYKKKLARLSLFFLFLPMVSCLTAGDDQWASFGKNQEPVANAGLDQEIVIISMYCVKSCATSGGRSGKSVRIFAQLFAIWIF